MTGKFKQLKWEVLDLKNITKFGNLPSRKFGNCISTHDNMIWVFGGVNEQNTS